MKKLENLYGDFLYDTVKTKNSLENLVSDADTSIRKAYYCACNMTAKMFELAKQNECSRSELKRAYSNLKKIEKIVESFKKDFKR